MNCCITCFELKESTSFLMNMRKFVSLGYTVQPSIGSSCFDTFQRSFNYISKEYQGLRKYYSHTNGCHCCTLWDIWKCMQCISMYNLGFSYLCCWWSVLPYKTYIAQDTLEYAKGGYHSCNRTCDLLPLPNLALTLKAITSSVYQ